VERGVQFFTMPNEETNGSVSTGCRRAPLSPIYAYADRLCSYLTPVQKAGVAERWEALLAENFASPACTPNGADQREPSRSGPIAICPLREFAAIVSCYLGATQIAAFRDEFEFECKINGWSAPRWAAATGSGAIFDLGFQFPEPSPLWS
jgi:hypothetical protein